MATLRKMSYLCVCLTLSTRTVEVIYSKHLEQHS